MLHLLGMPEERIVPEGVFTTPDSNTERPLVKHYTCVVNNRRVFVWAVDIQGTPTYQIMIGDRWPIPAKVTVNGEYAEDRWLRDVLMKVYHATRSKRILAIEQDPVLLSAMIYELTSGGK